MGSKKGRYFVGSEERSVDHHGRVAIPRRIWNGEERGEVYLRINEAAGFVDVMPPSIFESMKERLERRASEKTREREFGLLSKVKMDSKRRIILPPEIREDYSNYVSVIGMGDVVRIRAYRE